VASTSRRRASACPGRSCACGQSPRKERTHERSSIGLS
jgi:hypothetical protein